MKMTLLLSALLAMASSAFAAAAPPAANPAATDALPGAGPFTSRPPYQVAIATNDDPKWVAGARTYSEAWNKAPSGSGKATFHLFDDGFHGFRSGTRAAAKWPDLLKEFDAVK